MSAIGWSPIEPLDQNSIEVDFAEIDGLHRQWSDTKSWVEDSNPEAYAQFNEELSRSWAIETGIIEGLYELDRGITLTLVQQGFVSDYVERGSSNRSPEELIAILRDHRRAVDQAYEWIQASRPLTKWFMRSLHQGIAANQPTYRAVDQFGRYFEAQLHRGQFKRQSNNPTRDNGTVHSYCPPEQVESELDNLIDWYNSYAEDQHPLAVGAWLHHRFTQIHPFEDGNGRVVRALMTWHLVRRELLPIVITRDTRSEYISALEQADSGDLSRFVQLLVRLEKQTLLKALSVEHSPTLIVDTIDEVLDYIVDGSRKKQKKQEEEQRSVARTAVKLRERAEAVLEEEANRISRRLRESLGWEVRSDVLLGGPDEGNEYYFKREVLSTAQIAEHWVNFQEPRYFVRIKLRNNSSPRSPVMVFVVSLHSVGRTLTGVMAGTSFRKHYLYSTEVDDDLAEASDPEFQVCNLEPFLFTAADDGETLTPRFERWVKLGFNVAFRSWAQSVVEQA